MGEKTERRGVDDASPTAPPSRDVRRDSSNNRGVAFHDMGRIASRSRADNGTAALAEVSSVCDTLDMQRSMPASTVHRRSADARDGSARSLSRSATRRRAGSHGQPLLKVERARLVHQPGPFADKPVVDAMQGLQVDLHGRPHAVEKNCWEMAVPGAPHPCWPAAQMADRHGDDPRPEAEHGRVISTTDPRQKSGRFLSPARPRHRVGPPALAI
jgi:hypothetical protein